MPIDLPCSALEQRASTTCCCLARISPFHHSELLLGRGPGQGARLGDDGGRRACLIVSAGYVVFAVLDHSAALGGLAAGLAAVSLALAASGWKPREVGAMLAVIYGGAFVATGLACRWRERALIEPPHQ